MIDSVLLVAFGGPATPDEIRPFLEHVTRGRAIPRERLAAVARHYERMPGGRSPLNELTERQARALEEALPTVGLRLPIFVGMRNWHPYLEDTLAAMAAKGVTRALAIIMSALRSEASWERYMTDVAQAREQTPGAPEVVFAPAWSGHAGFIAAVVDRTRRAFETVPTERRSATPLVFTAHSIPVAMAEGAPYVGELTAAARMVARKLGHPTWLLAYQSRSGNPEEPWLEPDVNEVIRRLGAAHATDVVVTPLGFVCDHVEVLYDLDVEARATAEAAGVRFHRAGAVNDHPNFIAMLVDLVRRAAVA